jgi:acetyl esterase/lipase
MNDEDLRKPALRGAWSPLSIRERTMQAMMSFRLLASWLSLATAAPLMSGCVTPNASATQAEAVSPTIVRDVVYGHKAGMALTYDVFRPAKPNGAAVVHVISGGWRSQWAPPETRAPGYQDLLDRGFTVVALHHGSQPQFTIPEATDDLKRGVRFFRLHAADYGVDADRIGVWGASAGGQLALVPALMGDDGDPAAADPVLRAPLKVRTAVAYYPPSDVGQLIAPHLTPTQRAAPEYAPELYRSISPVFFIDADDAPVLVVHGDADAQVDVAQSRRLHQVLDAAGVKNRLIVMPGAGHQFVGAQADEARAAMLDWFTTHLLAHSSAR